MSNTDMTQAEELNLELEVIFDNSPTFWHSRIGTDPEKKTWYSLWEVVHY